jgi:hypothetical protein
MEIEGLKKGDTFYLAETYHVTPYKFTLKVDNDSFLADNGRYNGLYHVFQKSYTHDCFLNKNEAINKVVENLKLQIIELEKELILNENREL